MPMLKSPPPSWATGAMQPAHKATAIAVSVLLNPEDHQNATMAAKFCNQTLAEWISSLVNTALQP